MIRDKKKCEMNNSQDGIKSNLDCADIAIESI